MAAINVITAPGEAQVLMDGLDWTAAEGWNLHPLAGDFAVALYGAINAETGSHAETPFVICDGETPLISAHATAADGIVSMFGLPLAPAIHAELGKKRRKKAFTALFDQLTAIGAAHGAATALIRGDGTGDALGPVDLACIDRLAQPEAHVFALANVADGEAAVHRDLRSSFRSLVNWGREQLQMTYVNAANPDRDAFDRFPEFHAETAGSAVRGPAYWDTYWAALMAGRGEMSLGRLDDGSLAAATITVDAGGTTYYASGVYDRTKFDKPLAHFPVFDSMVRAGARGVGRYDLGEIFAAGVASEKEVQIGFFKKGFTATFEVRTNWRLQLNTD